jgi:hypothetical protein
MSKSNTIELIIILIIGTVLMSLGFIGSYMSRAEAKVVSKTYSQAEFVTKYHCVVPEPNTWTDGVDNVKANTIKTAVYSLPGDGTGLIRSNVNAATAAVVQNRGVLRLVCTKNVPLGTRVIWS